MLEDLCTVVRFEQRGCGRLDWDKRYDLDTTVSDIDFVRKAYGFNKVVVGDTQQVSGSHSHTRSNTRM